MATMSDSDRIVGFIDRLGYFRCAVCVAKHDREWTYPVYADTAPHNHEPCDVCGKAREGD